MALALPKSCRHGKWATNWLAITKFVAYGMDKKLCGPQVSCSTLESIYRVSMISWHPQSPNPPNPQSPVSWGAHPFLLSMSALITPTTIGSSQWIIGQPPWVELCLKSMTRRWAWMWHSLRTQPWACHYGNNSFQGILNLRDCRLQNKQHMFLFEHWRKMVSKPSPLV